MSVSMLVYGMPAVSTQIILIRVMMERFVTELIHVVRGHVVSTHEIHVEQISVENDLMTVFNVFWILIVVVERSVRQIVAFHRCVITMPSVMIQIHVR